MPAEELTVRIGPTTAACEALGVSRATLYRRRRPPLRRPHARPTPRRALRLHEQAEVRERRNQLRHPSYHKPELLATASNDVWSWDITKLLGPVKWTYFYLYVTLDIFSRYVSGWMVAHRESAALARRLIGASCAKQRITPGQLTIHADRGGSIRSNSLALLLADLGVSKTHSRPHVSNNNPYSEAQFKTLKYCPQFPKRFGCIEDARAFCRDFFNYYNTEQRHSGIGLLTPAAVHYGLADQVLATRHRTLLTAYGAHPERFVRRAPQPPILPREAWINSPARKTTSQDGSQSTIITPGNPWGPPGSGDVEDTTRSCDELLTLFTDPSTAEAAH